MSRPLCHVDRRRTGEKEDGLKGSSRATEKECARFGEGRGDFGKDNRGYMLERSHTHTKRPHTHTYSCNPVNGRRDFENSFVKRGVSVKTGVLLKTTVVDSILSKK